MKNLNGKNIIIDGSYKTLKNAINFCINTCETIKVKPVSQSLTTLTGTSVPLLIQAVIQLI